MDMRMALAQAVARVLGYCTGLAAVSGLPFIAAFKALTPASGFFKRDILASSSRKVMATLPSKVATVVLLDISWVSSVALEEGISDTVLIHSSETSSKRWRVEIFQFHRELKALMQSGDERIELVFVSHNVTDGSKGPFVAEDCTAEEPNLILVRSETHRTLGSETLNSLDYLVQTFRFCRQRERRHEALELEGL